MNKKTEPTKEMMQDIFKDLAMDTFKTKLGEKIIQQHDVNRDNVGLDKWIEIAKYEISKKNKKDLANKK